MTAREPSAVEVLAEAWFTALGWHWPTLSDGERLSCIREVEIGVAALKAAGFVVATRDEIRAMTPEQQAEVIGGRVETSLDFERERLVGPWREVQP